MQDHAGADLMSIGQHCAFPDCGQLDFLPFKCGCGQTFCLDHRTAAAHGCRLGAAEGKQVIVCPICAQGVELSPTDDPNIIFDRHQRNGCDPANYARVHKKPRCPARGCKEKLTTINTYTCKDCKAAVCLRHRLAQDHQCAGPSAASAAAAAAGQRMSASAALSAAAAAGRSVGAKASSMVSDWRASARAAAAAAGQGARVTSSTNANSRQQQRQQAQQQYADPGNSVYGTAHRRQLEWQQQQQGQQQQGAERCPQCSAAFANVQDLIQHVEVAHSNGAAGRQQQQQQSAGGGGEVFVCPRCSTRFSDAVMLLSHSEACGRGQDKCVLC